MLIRTGSLEPLTQPTLARESSFSLRKMMRCEFGAG